MVNVVFVKPMKLENQIWLGNRHTALSSIRDDFCMKESVGTTLVMQILP